VLAALAHLGIRQKSTIMLPIVQSPATSENMLQILVMIGHKSVQFLFIFPLVKLVCTVHFERVTYGEMIIMLTSYTVRFTWERQPAKLALRLSPGVGGLNKMTHIFLAI
jgi:hypothetical protein